MPYLSIVPRCERVFKYGLCQVQAFLVLIVYACVWLSFEPLSEKLCVSVTFYGSVIKELHAATAEDCPKIVNIYGKKLL